MYKVRGHHLGRLFYLFMNSQLYKNEIKYIAYKKHIKAKATVRHQRISLTDAFITIIQTLIVSTVT